MALRVRTAAPYKSLVFCRLSGNVEKERRELGADLQVFFAYAILTPEECTLFTHLSSLDTSVRNYLHSNGIAILPYDQVWAMLEGWTESIRRQKDERASKRAKVEEDVPMEEGSGEAKSPAAKNDGGVAKEGEDNQKEGKEKIEKTDKVLIGLKTSWAIAKAVGEVGLGIVPFQTSAHGGQR
jgi:Xaa-Pro aminopeptidase